jgi:hypothetical protein
MIQGRHPCRTRARARFWDLLRMQAGDADGTGAVPAGILAARLLRRDREQLHRHGAVGRRGMHDGRNTAAKTLSAA